MASFSRDWTLVPPELLELILAKLYLLSDYIRFCGVCPQWRLVGLESDNDHRENLILLRASRKKLPMLMIRTEEHSNNTRGLFSVSDGMTYNIKLPQPREDRFFSSSHGWLMYLEENHSITLLNPLSNRHLSLPIFEDSKHVNFNNYIFGIRNYYLLKGILSDDPSVNPDNYIVAVIYGSYKHLAFYKSGDMHWKFIKKGPLCDINFYKGNLYGVTVDGDLFQMDLRTSIVKTIVPINDLCSQGNAKYLVESREGLCMVQRFNLMEDKEDLTDDQMSDPLFVKCFETTSDFRIFKLVYVEDCGKWVQISKIGNQAFFVGLNRSFSVSTEEFPECASNSIYYVSQLYFSLLPYECCGLDEDSGVFNLEDGSFHSHHLLDNFEWYTEPPFWFVPNPDFDISA